MLISNLREGKLYRPVEHSITINATTYETPYIYINGGIDTIIIGQTPPRPLMMYVGKTIEEEKLNNTYNRYWFFISGKAYVLRHNSISLLVEVE